MSFTKISPNTLNELTFNTFMLLNEFNPAAFYPESSEIPGRTIIGSTTGGVKFSDVPTYIDLGEDIDNCPKNVMELKVKDDGEVKLSGNLVTVNANMVKMLMGAATITGYQITPDQELTTSHFTNTLWGLANYGKGGVIAIKMNRILNTSGFSVSTTDKNKGQFAFEFTCHKTINDLTTPPYEVYLIRPVSVMLTPNSVSLDLSEQYHYTDVVATVHPDGATITWSSSDSTVATVSPVPTASSTGRVSAVGAGTCIVTASATVGGRTNYATIPVTVMGST